MAEQRVMNKETPRPKRVVHVSRGTFKMSGCSRITVRRAAEQETQKPAPKPKRRPRIATGEWEKKR